MNYIILKNIYVMIFECVYECVSMKTRRGVSFEVPEVNIAHVKKIVRNFEL